MRSGRWIIAWIGVAVLALGSTARLAAQPPSPEAARAPSAPAVPGALPEEVIILKDASDLNTFWTKLGRPDLILTKPGEDDSERRPGTSPSPAKVRTHVVSAVKIKGRVDDDLASLEVELELSLLVPGPVWVPLGIDVPIIASAREGDRELELRRASRETWEARVGGNGPHRIQCQVKVPLRVTPDRKRLELAIPYAASTYLELDVPHQVFEVDLGTGEGVGKTPMTDGKGTRLSAHMSPRSRLALEWTDQGSNSAAPPLLAARLEIAIDADAEWITTLSAWEVRCIRGVARSLEIRIDEPEIVQVLKLNDQLLMTRVEGNVLSVPLTEPLRVNGVLRLTLQTRRPVPSGSPGRFDFKGLPLLNALEQSGAIGVTPSANVWVNASATSGLRRIDPGELPKDLRARPGIGLAFRFLDQPFRLGLEIEENPPLYRTKAESAIYLEGDVARTETSIEVQRIRGRVYELGIELPAGLELVSVDPGDLVEVTTPSAAADPSARASADRPAGRAVTLHLTAAARDQRSFMLRLRGRQRIAEGGAVTLGLFAPLGGVPVGGEAVVQGERGLSFEPLADQAEPGRAASNGPPASPGSNDRAATSRSGRRVLASFRSQDRLAIVRGRLVRLPRSLSSETSVVAQIAGDAIEVNQETSIRVRNGSLSSLTVKVPLESGGAWQVSQGKESVRREEIARIPGEGGTYRLHFDPPVLESASLTFQFRRPLNSAPIPGKAIEDAVRWVSVEETTPERLGVTIASSPDLRATVEDATWMRVAGDGDEARGRYRPSAPAQLRARELPISIRQLDRVALPPVVVPRALLRSVLTADQQARTQAWFWVESHPSELSVRLPVGSRWVRARIDGRVADQVETGPSGGGYRIRLPESHTKPALVELEYQSPTPAEPSALEAPELGSGAVVLQTFWLVQIPWNKAVIGVPSGWDDENEWYWDAYVWKRRPWRSLARLTAWAAGSATPATGQEDGIGDDPGDAHVYLFGKSGAPGNLRLAVAHRSWLVALCSGLVLLAGLLVMYSRALLRSAWLALAAIGLAFVVLARPSVVFLVAQSAFFGVVLTLVGLIIQRIVERARQAGSPVASPPAGPPSTASGVAATPSGPSGVGSDDSTAIRVRVTPSTMDHKVSPLVLQPREAEPAGSSRVRSPG